MYTISRDAEYLLNSNKKVLVAGGNGLVAIGSSTVAGGNGLVAIGSSTVAEVAALSFY